MCRSVVLYVWLLCTANSSAIYTTGHFVSIVLVVAVWHLATSVCASHLTSVYINICLLCLRLSQVLDSSSASDLLAYRLRDMYGAEAAAGRLSGGLPGYEEEYELSSLASHDIRTPGELWLHDLVGCMFQDCGAPMP